MDEFAASGQFTLDVAAMARAESLFSAYRLDDSGTIAEIASTAKNGGMLLDPHSAVGLSAARRARADGIIASGYTSCQPCLRPSGKFENAVKAATGSAPALPPHMADLMNRPEQMQTIAADVDAVKALVLAQKAKRMTINVSKLGNGLKIATRSMPYASTLSIGIWVNAGARDEKDGEQGIAHMLEHVTFKGTKRRDAQAIATEVENVGGFMNAHTSREETILSPATARTS